MGILSIDPWSPLASTKRVVKIARLYTKWRIKVLKKKIDAWPLWGVRDVPTAAQPE